MASTYVVPVAVSNVPIADAVTVLVVNCWVRSNASRVWAPAIGPRSNVRNAAAAMEAAAVSLLLWDGRCWLPDAASPSSGRW
ncbi:hypothetical protein GTA28_28985 [Rhodococcus hoagii]|nr:hypothetical protein [Prescottella equi]